MQFVTTNDTGGSAMQKWIVSLAVLAVVLVSGGTAYARVAPGESVSLP